MILVENLPVPFDRRVWQESLSLVERGVQLSVICPAMLGYDSPRETLDGVSILRHRLPEEVSSARGYVREYFSAFVGQSRLLRRLWRESRFDVIHVCNPPDTLFLAALPYLLRGVKLIYDQHDRSPELYEAKYGKRGLFHRALLAAERLTFACATAVVAPNQTHADIATGRGHVGKDQVFIVRSIPDPADFHAGAGGPQTPFPFEHLVGYLGVMGEQDGVDLLVRAAEHIVKVLGRTDIGFALMGGGPAYPYVTGLAERLGVTDNVKFLGYVDRTYAASVLGSCDIGVAPDPKNVYTDGCTMNKIFEYMFLGRPIVQFDLVEDRRIAEDAAWYAENNDPVSLAEKIVALVDDEGARAAMSRRAVDRCVSFSWAQEADNLALAYSLAGQKSRRFGRRLSRQQTELAANDAG